MYHCTHHRRPGQRDSSSLENKGNISKIQSEIIQYILDVSSLQLPKKSQKDTLINNIFYSFRSPTSTDSKIRIKQVGQKP